MSANDPKRTCPVRVHAYGKAPLGSDTVWLGFSFFDFWIASLRRAGDIAENCVVAK